MSAPVRPVGPCPDWCDLGEGHDWWGEEDGTGRVSRRHSISFARGEGPHAEVQAVEYADETELRQMVITLIDVGGGDLDPYDALCLAESLSRASEWRHSREGGPWWRTAPNPPCRSWCESEHQPDDFASLGMLVCYAHLAVPGAAVTEVEVSASTRCDDSPGAQRGCLVYDAPEIEIYTANDGRDGECVTPEGFERAMREVPAVLAEARRIVATDDHATDEQRAAVVA